MNGARSTNEITENSAQEAGGSDFRFSDSRCAILYLQRRSVCHHNSVRLSCCLSVTRVDSGNG